ncbi:two-component system response regulator [Cellulomonas cellasea]|uniref:ActR/RegA family two-component response regulator n=1 Tax=Cellulomonas cellasea TaxID=43670 RepID=A0A7W4YBK7_9CELL|nr:response regulator [Cellulomonas cellasea]MBB2924010.1 ActR/RegA family two-component response regulator [Cellulomonas cellasea]
MRQTSDTDILVVDDILSAAEDYARLIGANTGLSVEFTNEPARALELVRANRIKVAVLDQRLDGKTPDAGTELYRLLHEIDPLCRAIMLTGEASQAEIGMALTLGFRDYLAKSDIRQLASRVVRQYAAYQAEVASLALASDQPIVLRRPGGRQWFAKRQQATFRLTDVEPIDEEFVDEHEWQSVITVHAGQRETHQFTWETERTITLESETTQRLSDEIGLSVKQVATLQAKLSAELSSRFKEVASIRSRTTTTSERTFELPSEPADPTAAHIRLRRVLHAPAYRRVRVNLASSCECCGLRNLVTVDVRIPTGRRALRQEDRWSDGQVKVYDLGVE